MSAEQATNVAAGAAITNYFWLPTLEQAHSVAAFIFTVAGILWIVLQAYCKITGACGDRQRRE